MQTRARLVTMRGRTPGKDSPLTPDLKAFIDRVMVPALVKDYLAVTAGENELASSAPQSPDSSQQQGRIFRRDVTP
jgi:hypothetical protein